MSSPRPSLLDRQAEILAAYRSAPSAFNVLDSVGLNENAHTRILARLLETRVDGRFLFLESFLNRISPELRSQAKPEMRKAVEVGNQRSYVDCWIEIGDVTVLIENKIHGAQDGERQLTQYIETAAKGGRSERHLRVLYLTSAGGEPPDFSLVPEDRKRLGDRLISINYLNHIVPWLREDVLPRCPYGDTELFESVELYAAFLSRILGRGKDSSTLVRFLLQAMGIRGVPEDYEVVQKWAEEHGTRYQELTPGDPKDLSDAIAMVLRNLEDRYPTLNPDNLRWRLKTWASKELGPRVIPRVFTTPEGEHYLGLKLANAFNAELHFACDGKGGKGGPYILESEKLPPVPENHSFLGKMENTSRPNTPHIWSKLPNNRPQISFEEICTHLKQFIDAVETLAATAGPTPN